VQHIDALFRVGKAHSVFPVKVIYHLVPRGAECAPVRAGFSVPKKKFRKAVQRNRIKRILRESWRIRKHLLYPEISPEIQLHLFFIFIGLAMPEYQQVQAPMEQIIRKLSDSIRQAPQVSS
jgi:ribonuclease P protein component